MKCERRFLRQLIIAAITVGFLVLDFCGAGLRDSRDTLGHALFIGACFGQLNLLAIWAVLAPGTAMVRFPWPFFLCAMMWYALVLRQSHPGFIDNLLGKRVAQYYSTIAWEDSLLLGVLLVTGVVALQVPLWIVAKLCPWQLCSRTTQPARAEAGTSQFHIKHLMLTVSLCAVALALGRALLPRRDDYEFIRIEDLRELIIPIAGLFVSSVLITLPAIWAAFARPSRLLNFAAVWLLNCAVIATAEVAVFAAIESPPPAETMRIMLIVYVLNLSQWLTVTGVLLILRALGLQLQRRGPNGLPPATSNPFYAPQRPDSRR